MKTKGRQKVWARNNAGQVGKNNVTPGTQENCFHQVSIPPSPESSCRSSTCGEDDTSQPSCLPALNYSTSRVFLLSLQRSPEKEKEVEMIVSFDLSLSRANLAWV